MTNTEIQIKHKNTALDLSQNLIMHVVVAQQDSAKILGEAEILS